MGNHPTTMRRGRKMPDERLRGRFLLATAIDRDLDPRKIGHHGFATRAERTEYVNALKKVQRQIRLKPFDGLGSRRKRRSSALRVGKW